MTQGFTASDVADQSGRTFFITGANTGLGFETARVLAGRRGRVILGCRSEAKAVAAIESIRTETPGADVDHILIDQADLQSVRQAADQLASEDRLDVLINNAGIMRPPRQLTNDGFESQFGVNHLGTFALTSHLLPKLAENETGRVVITSSIAHRDGEIYFDDIAAEQSYDPMGRYRQSKLANLMFMFELDRRLRASGSSTVAVACHPGIADTDLFKSMPGWMKLLTPIVKPFFNSAAAGAWPTLLAAVGPNVEGGHYYGPAKRNETAGPAVRATPNATSQDPQLGKRLWDLSIEMTNVDPGI